jgi:cell division transport system ATP-binding protein
MPSSDTTATAPPAPGLGLQAAAVRSPGTKASGTPVSLTLPAGGSHVLAGRPGSGKSAILEMIGLARAPGSGRMDLFGKNVADVPRAERYRLRRRIGVIFQDLRLVDDLSAHANVVLAARAAGREADDYGGHVEEALAWVGLGRRMDSPAGSLDIEALSRLAVARAVINRPDVVIADEPTGRGGREILRLLGELNRGGAAVLVASSDEALIASAGGDATWLGGAPAAVRSELPSEVSS